MLPKNDYEGTKNRLHKENGTKEHWKRKYVQSICIPNDSIDIPTESQVVLADYVPQIN